MPRRCSVLSCRSNCRDQNSVGKYVCCYGFPSDARTSKKWLIAIGRPNYVPNYDSAVCAKHFDVSSFLRKDMYRGFNGELKAFKFAKPKLENNAVPSLFLGVGRETNVDKTDCPFGAQKKAVMPLSTLDNDVQREGEDVMLKQHDVRVDIDDIRTCMDFVEVEMKDPDNEGKTLNLDENLCGSVDFRTNNCFSGRRIGKSAKKMRICGTRRTERFNNYRVISIRNSVQEKYVNDDPATNFQRSPSCDAKGGKFVNTVMGRLGGANVLNHSNLSVVMLDRARMGGHCDIIKTANNTGRLGVDKNHPEGTAQKNCEVGVVGTKVEDKGSPCEETLNLVVNLGNREEQVISSEDCQGKDNPKATLKNCSVSSICGENGVLTEKGEIRGKENMVVVDANETGDVVNSQTLEEKIGCGSNHGFLKTSRKMVSRKDCCVVKDVVCVENVGMKEESGGTPDTENVDLVLINANASRSDGTKDLGGSLGNSEVKAGGQNRGSEKCKDGEDEGPSEVQEWEGGWVVKEELFRGLGLVPRGVLHDRSVDRRHCVRGQRRSEVSTKRLRSPTKTAVFYPPGTAMFDTEKFIGEIQKRPAIYDVRSKVYSNRVAKLKYWHEVGKEMYKGWDILDQMERRTLVKELQIKWKSIRDHFMRQLKQNMNGEGPKKKKYVHFDQLQFLTANLGVKRPRHSFKPPKHEPEEEYMELTPELPEERHFSFMTSVERPDYDEHEVPVAAALLPQQPEDLSYHPKDLPFHHHQELSYHKELEGDRMGNKMFLLSLLPIMERLPDHSNIRARLQLMEVLQTFVAHEDTTHRDFYNYHDEKQSCGDASQQHSTASHTDSDT